MGFIQSLPSQIIRNLLANLDLAVLFGTFYLMSHMVKRRAIGQGLDANTIADLSFWIAVGALIGARLGYVLPVMEQQLSHPLDLVRINSGLYFYGALAGGLGSRPVKWCKSTSSC